MREIIKMTVDLEIEMDLGEVTDDKLADFKEKTGFDLLDENGNMSKKAMEWEKQTYLEGVKEDLEYMDYKVNDIYNFEPKLVN